MGLKASLSKPFARAAMVELRMRTAQPGVAQIKQLNEILKSSENTAFGKDHNLREGMSLASFQKNIPVNGYEGIKKYINRAVKGEENVLWPGKPMYFCKTSGTTSGDKYIPITEDSLPNHLNSARNALLGQIAGSGNADFVSGKMMFLQGSPKLEQTKGGVPLGRLSGIAAHHVPNYLQRNRLPSMEANTIDDWEKKVKAIVKETADQDLRLISGIPTWVQMYFEQLLKHTKAETVQEVFPNLSLFVHGGAAYTPYAERFKQLLGFDIDRVELYPASEGFLAYQDKPGVEGMRLNIADGIFFEFIPADKFGEKDAPCLTLDQVEMGMNYAIIITTKAGLYRYAIGDTVKFVCDEPYRVIVTGRTAHYISAFGEHVIGEEVESSIAEVCEKHEVVIRDFHLAPEVAPKKGLPYHEWFIEFETNPKSMKDFSADLCHALQARNSYYADLILGKVIHPAVVTQVKKNGFNKAMAASGKLGGQNKIPRLSNDRTFADQL
ncbi:MAG: hypothetical protein CL847_00095 [Crocinitomicaceae bacterium]|nr:hypothetical protein [Crocinitomicaceae bacterium]|tara:strand:+ start:13661 stop:15145 length:1485 start_codon:yes stop_codon:yes gene_type:complete